jgi:hypothetical protein
MANVIRYKTSQPTKRGLRKGNTVIGIGEENYGPTSTTGYVNGITPPDGGYVVYILSSNNDPAIYVAETDEDLVDIARTLGGGFLSLLEAKNYLNSRSNTWFISSMPQNTVTDGLVLNLDASNESSFIDNEPTTNLVSFNGDINPNSGTGQYTLYRYQSGAGTITLTSTGSEFGKTYIECYMEKTTNDARLFYPWCEISDKTVSYQLSYEYKVLSADSNMGLYAGGYAFFVGGSDSDSAVNYTRFNEQYLGSTGLSGGVDIGNGWYKKTVTIPANTFVASGTDGSGTGGTGNRFRVGFYGSWGQTQTHHFRIANLQVERKDSPTGFTTGSRSQNTTWYDLSGNGFDYDIIGSPSYSEGAFTLTETTGFRASHNITNSTTATVVVFYKTTDGQELWATGQSNSYYIAASYGNNYYHQNAGSPSYYVDTISVSNPTSYRNGKYHMWEAKNVNLSTWTRMWFWQYGSSWNMNGTVAKIMVYDRALTAAESQQNYYGGPIVTDGLVLAMNAGNLVSYESGSTTAYSMTGSLSGSLVNGVGYSSNNGGGWGFDGANDRINLGNPNSLNFGTGNFSISVWFSNTNDSTYNCLYGDYGTGDKWVQVRDDRRIRCGFRDASNNENDYTTSYYVTDGVIYNVVFLRDGNDNRIYVNGVLINTKTVAGVGSTDSGTDKFIGSLSNVANHHKGNIYNTYIYNKALTSDEVLQNFNAQKARFL